MKYICHIMHTDIYLYIDLTLFLIRLKYSEMLGLQAILNMFFTCFETHKIISQLHLSEEQCEGSPLSRSAFFEWRAIVVLVAL